MSPSQQNRLCRRDDVKDPELGRWPRITEQQGPYQGVAGQSQRRREEEAEEGQGRDPGASKGPSTAGLPGWLRTERGDTCAALNAHPCPFSQQPHDVHTHMPRGIVSAQTQKAVTRPDRLSLGQMVKKLTQPKQRHAYNF